MDIKDLTPANPNLAFIVPKDYEDDGSINTAMGITNERQKALVKEMDVNKNLVFGIGKEVMLTDILGLISYTAKTPQELTFLAMSVGKLAKAVLGGVPWD